jgi:1-acyl-sn-glycerol-3-phosphate acyltransferase
MPDKTIFWGLPKVIMHEPIDTSIYSKENLEELKTRVYEIIQNELDAYKNGN